MHYRGNVFTYYEIMQFFTAGAEAIGSKNETALRL